MIATESVFQTAEEQAAASALFELKQRLRQSMRGALGFARTREAKKAAAGKRAAKVTVTLDQLMAKLRANDYRCALSGVEFYNDGGGSFGPTRPSIDRIDPDGDYSDRNTRVVLLGVNSGRGRGSDADLLRIAQGLVASLRI